MREVSVFYAFDDTEFFDRDECAEYEMQMLEYLKEINEKYSFFDKDMNLFMSPHSDDIEDWIDWLDNAAERCMFIYRDENLSNAANRSLSEYCGYCINNEDFDYNVGWFKYDMRLTEWLKVDD